MLRLTWTALVATVAVAAGSSGVSAQALPAWKITDICAKESAPGQCAAFEGRALKAVSSSWTFVLDPIKKACLGELKTPYESWRLLAECLDSETQKALDKTAVHTARTPAEPVPPPRPLVPTLQIEIPPAPELKPQ